MDKIKGIGSLRVDGFVRNTWFIALGIAVLFIAAGAQAQPRYTCTSNGRTYQSTQPCPGSGVVYYGPSGTQTIYQTPIPKAPPPPANLKYLTPRCASLNDAIRMGPTNGLNYDTISQMRREYSLECSESESASNALMAQERRDKKDQLTQAKNANKLDKERALIHQQQCGESKRILFSKRARTDLTDGEKAELRRFEENYNSRCG
ncbi:MAG: hypothetical protein IPG23_06445 [Burkholderiales bacterium]|nr:hypothetical protein [Burkholderiales bacterium]